MSALLDRHPSLLFVILFLALGIAGGMDYADAKLQEKTMCRHNQKPGWCKK